MALQFHLPPPDPDIIDEAHSQSLLRYIFGGFWEFLGTRQFLILCLSYWLFAVAFGVLGNVSLNLPSRLGVEPKALAGTMLALRFGGKVIAGLCLGFILTRWGARAATVTGVIVGAVAVIWAMGVHGSAYLAAFALLGATELSCVYYTNYCVSASPPESVKRNLALLNVALLPSFGASAFHGWLADHFGFNASFIFALATALVAAALARSLPAIRPRRTP